MSNEEFKSVLTNLGGKSIVRNGRFTENLEKLTEEECNEMLLAMGLTEKDEIPISDLIKLLSQKF